MWTDGQADIRQLICEGAKKKNLNICFVVEVTHLIFKELFDKKKRIQFSEYLNRQYDQSHVATLQISLKLHVKVRVI